VRPYHHLFYKDYWVTISDTHGVHISQGMRILWLRKDITGDNVKAAFDYIDRLIFLEEEGHTS
jgi:hypothetical protein